MDLASNSINFSNMHAKLNSFFLVSVPKQGFTLALHRFETPIFDSCFKKLEEKVKNCIFCPFHVNTKLIS